MSAARRNEPQKPADPERFERDVRAVTDDVLRRELPTREERAELREVRVDGSYPDTHVVVVIWDESDPDNAHEFVHQRPIWDANFVRAEGVFDTPRNIGLHIAISGMEWLGRRRRTRAALGEELEAHVNRERFERDTREIAEEILIRSFATQEREELREVRLEGSYPDTELVIVMWDGRNPANARERSHRRRIWDPFFIRAGGGFETPRNIGLDIAVSAMGG